MITTLTDSNGHVTARFNLDSSFGCKREDQLKTVRCDGAGNWRGHYDVYWHVFCVKWNALDGSRAERKFVEKSNAEKFLKKMLRRDSTAELNNCGDGLHKVWDA